MLREFSWGMSLANESASKPLEVGDIVNALLAALNNQARAKPHPLTYISMGLVVTLIVLAVQSGINYGSLTTRVAALEARTQGVEVLNTKIDSLNQRFQEFADRYDRATSPPRR
jgi:hypothetical protein